ncbi:uncharacterized protein LOC122787969 [Protopterus annectens]|uniref:uncharacterized protein LOC122787969 n=1 Tax=Protopterus annectens TaxID=7888 RepID=UPI001CFC0D0B|nr:uncharacterized protein LOC122787969 [Protopterus annectens]
MENTSAKHQHWQVKLPSSYWMFNMPWLDSSLSETLLPEKAWQKVYEEVSSALALEVEVHLQEPYQRQMIFEFLGKHFVQKYFSTYPNRPSLLTVPHMSTREMENLKESTATLLKEQCDKVTKHNHYHWQSGDEYKRLSLEMMQFIKDTFDTVLEEMNWVLSKYEAQQNDIESRTATFRNVYMERRAKFVDSHKVHLTNGQGGTYHTSDKDGNIIVPELRPPPLNCPESDILGESLCAILASDPERLSSVCERLKGKLLPKALRHFIWNDKLLTANKNFQKIDTIGNIEKSARKSFGQVVARKATEMKLRSATHSTISNLVQNVVVEEYEKTPCMQVFTSDELMISETCKALNILYVFNGTYEPYLIHLLFPLQVAFRKMPPAATPHRKVQLEFENSSDVCSSRALP